MINKNIFSIVLIGLIWINTTISQPWMPIENDSINYQKAVASFNNYWADKEIEKGKGFKQFKSLNQQHDKYNNLGTTKFTLAL